MVARKTVLLMTPDESVAELAATLSDAELDRELQLAERAALLSVRTRRELALRRLRFLRRELQRRGVGGRVVSSTLPVER
jgi:hypothetical protein